ncbi:MAG TPA: transglutaminase domain-containing protein, partial [Labilithrix sp.]
DAAPRIVLVPDRAGAVATDGPLVALPSGELRWGGPVPRPVRWEAWISRGNIQVTNGNIDVTTPVASARVRALAHAWADDGAAPLAKARAIERRLRDGFAYDLRSPSRGAIDPLDDFLFVTRRGHCELFASALAVMLREVGVPARVVTGYVGGDWNAFGRFYAVRDRDAHAWVEAWTGSAWTTLDATPTAPRVVDSGALTTARDLVEALARRGEEPAWIRTLRAVLLAALALALLFAIATRVFRVAVRTVGAPASIGRRPRGADHEAAALYAKLDAVLVARGVPRDRSEPPLRHAELLAEKRHPLAPEIVALTRVYLEARFGGATLTRAARRDFEQRVRRLGETAEPTSSYSR